MSAPDLADLQERTEDELEWDLRALRASEELTGEHAGLQVEAFLPSLHLNLADDYRRLCARSRRATISTSRGSGSQHWGRMRTAT